MSTAHEVGTDEGKRAYDAGLPCRPSRSAFINDAGAAMIYRDAFRAAWIARRDELCVLSGLPQVGQTVRFLRNGTPQEAVVTYVYPKLDPPRFEGNLVVKDKNEWLYPGDSDKRVWAYISDILEIIQN